MKGNCVRGQGATEYLVVLGAVLLIAIVGVTTINQATGSTSLKEQQSTTYWKTATPFGIIAYVLNENALSIRLSNNLNEKIKLTSIKVTYNGANYTIYSENRVFGSGEQVELTNIDLRFSAANPCNTLQTGSPFEYTQVIFGYDKQSLSGFYQTGDKPLVGKCGGQASLVNVSGDSPASGQSVAQNVSLNLTVQSSSLSGMNFSFNGTSSSFYDPSLVLALDFEDNPAIGDNDTNIVDVSQYGNNGTIYDNTVGLWRLDETDGTTAADSTRFGNTGTIYGPTAGLWKFDEGDNRTINDASNWGNNGTLYGSTIGLWRFDEADNTSARDATAYGNNGIIYGNTLGLWRFDEGDNKTAADSTAYGNNATLYGNTIGLWHFDENSGIFANDSSAYGNNGTCQTVFTNASCVWSAGKSGSSATFNGINTTVTLPESLGGNYTSLSISLWTKTTQVAGDYNRSFTLYRTVGSTYFSLGQTANKTSLGWSSWGVFLISNGTDTNDGNWHHIVGIKNATAAWLYQDGMLVGVNLSTTFPSSSQIISPTIGGFNNSGSNTFGWNGSIDEVQMINATISKAEVSAVYAAGKAKFLEWNSSGKSGNALEFDGAKNFVNASAFNIPGDVTISAWVYPRSYQPSPLGHNQRILFNYNGTTDLQVILNETDTLIWGSSVLAAGTGSSTLPNLNNWTHVAFTRSGLASDSSSYHIYYNGILQGSSAKTPGNPNSAIPTLRIGADMHNTKANGHFNGSIDEVQIINKSLSAEEVAEIYNSGKAKFVEWAAGKSGTGLQFDGISGYFRTTNQIQFGSNATTYSAWVKARGFNNPRIGTLFADASQGGSAGFVWIYRQAHSNATVIQYANGTNYWPVSFANFFDGYIDQWVHVVVSIDYLSKNITLYRNGQVFGTVSPSDNMLGLSTPKTIFVGRYSSTDNSVFNGSMDEIAIYNRTLSADEVLDHYTSGRAKFIEWNSTGKSGTALNFDNNTYASLGYGTNLNLTGALTLSAWVYPTTNDSFYRGVFGSGQAQDTIHGRYLFFYRNGEFKFEVSNGSARHYVSYGVPSISTWYHVVGAWDGTNSTNGIRFYVNGDNVANTTANFSNITTFKPWYVGRDSWNGATRRFIGMVDEAQAISYALNATEVANLYNAGKAKFVEHVPWGKSGSALRFDGNRSYVDLGNPSQLTLNQSNFTISAWAYPLSLSGSQSFIISHAGSGTYKDYGLSVSNSSIAGNMWNTTGSSSGTSIVYYSPQLLQWTHLAYTFNGSYSALYVNGTLANVSTAFVGSRNPLSGTPTTVQIGSRATSPAYFFNGEIDEVQIVNRTLSAAEIAAQYASGRARRDSWTPSGSAGSAMQFDGANDYVNITNAQAFNFSLADNYTIGAWALFGNTTISRKTIVEKLVNGRYPFALRGSSNGTNSGAFIAIYNGTTAAEADDNQLGLTGWHNIVGVKSGNQLLIYSDGVLRNTTVIDLTGEVFNEANVFVGRRGNGLTPFKGSIDEVRIWNCALTPDEVAQNYYGSLTKFAPDSWLFSYNRTLVPAGTYYYYGYVKNADGSFDYTDNRSIVVTG